MTQITETQLKLYLESIFIQDEIKNICKKENINKNIINKIKNLSNRLWRLGMYYNSKDKLKFDKKNKFIDPYK